MKKNILFLFFALILTGNPILGMKRKMGIGDDPNPSKRRKTSHQKQRTVIAEAIEEPKDLKNILDIVPYDVLSGVTCRYCTFADLHSLMLSNKYLYQLVKYFFDRVLQINLQDIRQICTSVFHHEIAKITHVCITVNPNVVKDYDDAKVSLNRLVQFSKKMNCPLAIDFADPNENLTIKRIRQLFGNLPNLKKLHINKSTYLEKRIEEATKGKNRLVGTRFNKYKENLIFTFNLVQLNQLYNTESPYKEERTEAIEKRRIREMARRDRQIEPEQQIQLAPTPTVSTGTSLIDIFPYLTEEALDNFAKDDPQIALLVQKYRKTRNQ